MTRNSKLSVALLPLLVTLACTDANKAPAEAAVKAAETAVATLNEEVSQLVPEQTKAVRDGLASAKTALAKQDYKAARTSAEGLPAKAAQAVAAAQVKRAELAKAAAAKAAELKKGFDEDVAKLSKKVAALKTKVASLSKSKRLPAGVTKAAVTKAKETLLSIETSFAAAKAQFATDAAGAVASAKELEQRAAELAKSLKMK